MGQRSIEKVRILVIEDERDLRKILVKWLTESGYAVQSAGDGFQALQLAKQQPFDIVLTDLKLPGLDGLQLLKLLKDRDPSLMVIFLSGQGTINDAIAALREGRAFDFIQKPLRTLRQLNLTIEKALLRRQADRTLEVSGEFTGTAHPIDMLSARELELVRLLGQGYETRAIAEYLGLSEKTIRNNLTQLYEKLGVKNRVQAVLLCLQQSLA